MKLQLPLYGRVLGWFFLNLALLAVAIWAVFRTEFKLEPLLGSMARERVMPVAESLMGELRERPRGDWGKILERFGEAYGIGFLLVDETGQSIAGESVALPEAVKERLRQPGGGAPENPMREGGGRPGGPAEERWEGPGHGREAGGTPGRPPGMGGRRRNAGVAPQFLRSRSPDRYWFILHVGPPGGMDRRPLRLLMVSNSISANGLFFDPKPWVLGGAGVLIFSVLWWIPFVRGITKELGLMTRNTQRIAEGRFDLDTGSGRGDELGRLDGAIRQMASRLDGFVHGQRRFLGDIAHELCSPLARMEMALAVLEQRADARQQEYVADVREEVREMSSLVNELMSFSKAGIRGISNELVAVNLKEVVDAVVARESSGAVGIRVDVPADCSVRAEPKLLTRALANLLRNAVRHAGTSGPIQIVAESEAGRVAVSVLDEGPGVPIEALGRLGEPFYRPDAARARETGGFGLGLAIVRTCAEACQGTVEFANRQPKGFRATLRLGRV